jgi:hypothetical protein
MTSMLEASHPLDILGTAPTPEQRQDFMTRASNVSRVVTHSSR